VHGAFSRRHGLGSGVVRGEGVCHALVPNPRPRRGGTPAGERLGRTFQVSNVQCGYELERASVKRAGTGGPERCRSQVETARHTAAAVLVTRSTRTSGPRARRGPTTGAINGPDLTATRNGQIRVKRGVDMGIGTRRRERPHTHRGLTVHASRD
jgi:hypothetical protein